MAELNETLIFEEEDEEENGSPERKVASGFERE